MTSGTASRSASPADRLRAGEAERRRRSDPTAIVERLAQRGRAAGQLHPVAAAAATAARMAALATPHDFADEVGVAWADLAQAEAGRVPFGALPVPLGARLLQLEVDLLAVADLARWWDGRRAPEPARN